MSYVEQHLIPGESIQYQTKLHWIVMAGHTVIAILLALLAIAIPFFMIEPTSLPLTVGILTGLMWVPFSWMIQHWVGLFHGIARTVLVTAAWYLFPQRRFVAIPAVIVVIYLITIVVLARRPGPSPNERR